MTVERIAQLDKLDFRWTKRRQVQPVNRRNDERWLEMYEKLKAYHEKHGHSKVPQRVNESDDPDQKEQLGVWISYQRMARDRMPQSRKDLLDELDLNWSADTWDTIYEQLVKFRQEHGHTDVPAVAGTRSLGLWCRKQRGYMRQNTLPLERRSRLEEINFVFELQSEKNERIWNGKFQRLEKYKREHGDCLVPSKNTANAVVEDSELSVWVTHQRTDYNRGTIPNHRMQKLEEIGFVWSIVERGSQSATEKHELLWEKSYKKLQEFYEVHGHFTVPTMLENGKVNPLSSWITIQRKHHAQCLLKKERRSKLNAIGFIWKKEHKRGTLSPEKEERLESIECWDPPPPRYQERGDNNGKSEEDDDDRNPTAKRRRTTPTEPPAKRRRLVLPVHQPKNMKRRQSSAEVSL
jgi:hypothetical protein